MDYGVRFVADALLPGDRQWAICTQDGTATVLCLADSLAPTPRQQRDALAAVLREAWAGYRAMLADDDGTLLESARP